MDLARTVTRAVVDFALPPRCPSCGTVTDEPDRFCLTCWETLPLLGKGCDCCGLPLSLGDDDALCGACLAERPVIDRTRSAIAYDKTARDIAIGLKYGRKTGLARTMAHYLDRHRGEWVAGETLLAPVPLHRWRLWSRGFNQSLLVARLLGKRWGVSVAPAALRRIRRTRPLKGMDPSQRAREVKSAFVVPEKAVVAGRTIVLVDDVLTSGATAEACAKALKKAGASRVELLTWARVVQQGRFVR